jgi:hypothetical protein
MLKKNKKIIKDEIVEDKQMIEEEQKFWKEKNIKEEQKLEVKKQVMKMLVITKCVRGHRMKFTKNIRSSLQDIIKHWKE